MNDAEYKATLRRAYELAAEIARLPLKDCAEQADRSLDVGALFHPSAWIAGSDLLECDRDAFRALATAGAELQRIVARRLSLELKRRGVDAPDDVVASLAELHR